MNDTDNISEAHRWLRYAKEDLEAANELIKINVAPRHACFLAQQAAEKAIKTIFVFCNLDFPRSHDLEALTNLIPQEWNLKNRDLDVSTLTEWAVEARYPGDWSEVTQKDAQIALSIAKEVYKTVAEDIEARELS